MPAPAWLALAAYGGSVSKDWPMAAAAAAKAMPVFLLPACLAIREGRERGLTVCRAWGRFATESRSPCSGVCLLPPPRSPCRRWPGRCCLVVGEGNENERARVGITCELRGGPSCSSLSLLPHSILCTPKHSPAVEIVRGEAAFIRRLGHAVVDAAVVVAGRHGHALAQTGRALGRPNGRSRRRLLRPRIE